ncbi:MAG: alkylmercury lyase [Spirochaetes bacterium]|jgi:hypothetical protein|nr:alkylmercury lyase [Spirochaetota bacterium]
MTLTIRTTRAYLEAMNVTSEATGLDIRFLYFNGCPNAAQTLVNLRAALRELDLDMEPEVVDVDPDSFDGPFLGSPSVLVNGVDVYTESVPDAFEFSCRMFVIGGERTGVLPVDLLRDRVRAAIDGGTDEREKLG